MAGIKLQYEIENLKTELSKTISDKGNTFNDKLHDSSYSLRKERAEDYFYLMRIFDLLIEICDRMDVEFSTVYDYIDSKITSES